MRVATKLAGVCVVRNACDLIGLVCGHYLRIGLGHIRFIDDGSIDGTREFLVRFARNEQRISVQLADKAIFHQAELVSEAANELIRRGFSMILPFDVDEFWNVSGPALQKHYANNAEIAFRGHWINFVQGGEAKSAGPFYLLRVKYRAPVLEDASQDNVCSFKRPFVGVTTTKIGFKAVRQIELDVGQHNLATGPQECDARRYEIFHLPLRNRDQIAARGLDHEPRRAPLRGHPLVSWQSLFHRQAVLAGRTDDVWSANSADRDGFLNCGGERIALRRDRRLQRLLLNSYAYVALRYRMLLP